MDTAKEYIDWYVRMFDDETWKDPNATYVAPTNFVERQWLQITERFTEAQIFMLFYVMVVVVYFISAGIFALFPLLGWFERYKIQWRREWPKAPSYIKCLKNIAFNYGEQRSNQHCVVVCAFPLAAASFPIMKAMGLRATLPLPPLSEFLLHMAIFLVAEDALHYAFHRILHIPILYKLIHKKHHDFSAPIGLAASYSTASEMLILAIPTFAPAMFFSPHFITFYSWFVLRQLDAVLRHCGYDFPDPLEIIPYYGGTYFHDYHHQSFVWNYASRFTYLDKIFGTYKESPDWDHDHRSPRRKKTK